jgi:hypothetical protein
MKTFRLHYAIIHGEYSYREWSDIKAPEMNLPRAADQLAEEYIPNHLSDERQAFSAELLSRGSAMLPHEDRAITGIRWEEIKPIVVTVRGGLVQEISDIPAGIRIKVVDWDTDELDKHGNPRPFVGYWDSRESSTAPDGS